MCDLLQEPEIQNHHLIYPFDSGFSMPHLNGLSSSPPIYHPTTTAATVGPHSQHPPCSSCGCSYCGSTSNPMKRRSPSPSPFSGPKPKKLFTDPDDNLSLRGFSKITLPFAFGTSTPVNPSPASQPPLNTHTQNHSLPVLRRCISDPCYPPESTPPDHSSGSGPLVNSRQSPENSKMNVNPVTPSSAENSSVLPPLPQSLRRTVSDPDPSPAKTSSPSPSKVKMGTDLIKEESPNSKRLRRMKERMKEMNQWWNEVMHEQEQEEADDYAGHFHNNNDLIKKNNCDVEIEESVGVERVGESLILRFKCPCGKGYKILLSGRNCFYKLV